MILTVRNTPLLLHPYLREINALYAIYIRVMDYKRRRADLTWAELAVARVYVGYGYVRDVWFNRTTATRIFRDRPRELTFTARLKRYRASVLRIPGDVFRPATPTEQEHAAIAEFLCDKWLDQADPDGNHC